MKKHHFKPACKNLIKTFLLTLSLIFAFSESYALLPYKYDWVKIKTPHFTVVVSKEHTKYGQSVANKAEEAFKRLQKLTTKHPKNTYIIVDHTKGFSNGSATFFPYATIRLQPITPDSTSSVGQYKDWLLELLIHEYTHILTFHNTKGLYTPLRWMLGSTVSPGYFQPTWYQEGLAVYTESHLSNGGRLRSSSYNAFKKELKAHNVALANEQNTNLYPFGSAPYIFGGWLNQDLLGNSNLKSASAVHHKLSGRVPYTINGAYKRVTKKSVYKSWKDLFHRRKETTFSPKAKSLGTLPFWNKENKSLYFSQLDSFLFDQVIKQSADGKQEPLFKSRNIIQLRVFGDHVYYLSLKVHQRDHQAYSLFRFNQKTKKTERLNTDKNIKGFDINEYGTALITASLQKQSLYFTTATDFNRELNFKKLKHIHSVDGETRLSNPILTSINELVFTVKKPGANEQLTAYHFDSETKTELFNAEHILDVEQGDGTWILFENNGQKKLTKTGQTKSMNVSNGIQQLSPRGDKTFAVSDTSHKGFYITNKSLIDLRTPASDGPQIPPYKNEGLIHKDFTNTKNYSSLTKLNPHYITPNFVVSPYGFSGAFLYGIGTGGQDPLGLHNYALSATTDSITDEVSYGASYTSNHFRLPIAVNGGIFYEPITLDFFTKSTYAKISTSFPLNLGFANKLNFTVSGLVNSTEIEIPEPIDTDGDGEADSTGPNNIIIENKRAGLSANFSYNRSETRTRELAPRKGYSIAFGATHYADSGDYFGYLQTFAGFRKFFKSPLHKKHRLILGVDGRVNDIRLPGIFASNSQNQLYRNIGLGGFALRGLPTSSISANDSLVMGHLEYRFPIVNINWGPGLLPGFFQRVSGALTSDYGSVKGFDRVRGVDIDHSTPLYSAGAELVFEGNAFYHVPASLQIGVYQFLNTDVYDGSPEVFVGFGLSGLPF